MMCALCRLACNNDGLIGEVHIALSLAGLERRKDAPWGQGAREAVEWAARLGAGQLVLDATMPGVRPRELDRSGRRDLASLLRRLGVGFAGVDAWIPSGHLIDPVHLDRAMDALDGAVGLCAELSDLCGATGRVVSIALPEGMSVVVGHRIATTAERAGVVVADHAVKRGVESARHGPIIGAGIDPAAVLAAGLDPLAVIASLKEPVAAARLTDMTAAGRVVAGTRGGRVDVGAYAASVHVNGYRGPLIGDLRNMTDQVRAAEALIVMQSPRG
jgi:sugar phosphate isomerase/epimerase